jgi:hypothetical protein
LNLVNDYLKWLKSEYEEKELKNGWTSIITPYLNRRNDMIEIFLKKSGNGLYLISDGGETISDLEACGLNFSSDKRQAILRSITNGLGIHCDEQKNLTVKATIGELPLKKHMLIQGIISIGDMFFLNSGNVRGIFLEEVQSWLNEVNAKYIDNFIINGDSGLTHHFDFALVGQTNKKRYLRVINNPDQKTIEAYAFSWIDCKKNRPNDSEAVAILNDATNRRSISKLSDALKSCDILPLRWSKRESLVDQVVNF